MICRTSPDQVSMKRIPPVFPVCQRYGIDFPASTEHIEHLQACLPACQESAMKLMVLYNRQRSLDGMAFRFLATYQ